MIFDCLWMYSENKLRFATNNKFVSGMPLLFKVGGSTQRLTDIWGRSCSENIKGSYYIQDNVLLLLKSAPGRVMVTVTVMCTVY